MDRPKAKKERSLLSRCVLAGMVACTVLSSAANAAEASFGFPAAPVDMNAQHRYASMQTIDLQKLGQELREEIRKEGIDETWDVNLIPDALPENQAKMLEQRACDGTLFKKNTGYANDLKALTKKEGGHNRANKTLYGIPANGVTMAAWRYVAGQGCHGDYFQKNATAFRAYVAVHESVHAVLHADWPLWKNAILGSMENDFQATPDMRSKIGSEPDYQWFIDESVADYAAMNYLQKRVQDEKSVARFRQDFSTLRHIDFASHTHATSFLLDRAKPVMRPDDHSLRASIMEAVEVIYSTKGMADYYNQSKKDSDNLQKGGALPQRAYTAQVRFNGP